MCVSASPQRRFQTRWEPGRIPVSLRFVCWRQLMLSHQRPRCLSCLRGRIWWCWEVWVDIQSWEGSWRSHPYWPDRKPLWGLWRQRRVAAFAPCISPEVVWVRRSFLQWIFWHGSRTATRGRLALQVPGASSVLHVQRPSQRHWGEICRDDYCNRLCRLYFCTVWRR